MKVFPVLFLFFAFLSIGLKTACTEQGPVIMTIDPRIGRMGELLTIQGSGFGNERNESFVTIAGAPPVSSAYISWSDNEIVLRLPEFGNAGLVQVHRGRQKSNPVLFANKLNVPLLCEISALGNGPRINSIQPASGPIGSLITIQGSNFGSFRGASGVFFSWNAIDPHTPGFVEVSEAEFGYELWSEREIRVRVPDGAVSGSLEVRSSRGTSQPAHFTVSGNPGTKTFRDRQTFLISYMTDIEIHRAVRPNALYIWMPQPVVSASQRNVRLYSRNLEPLVENHRGTSLFQFVDTVPGANFRISLSYKVEVYAVESSIRTQTPVRLNEASPVNTIYVLPSALVPSDNPGIRAQAAQIIRQERFPHARARMIYEWLISTLEIQWQPLTGGALEALEEREADSYRAALLFCALARAAGIPALPVAGVLVDRYDNTFRHYWAEFWLDGFGWIPVDPALGAGAAPANFDLREDHARYYFGNLDNQRIAFSRGERFLYRMTPHGRTTFRSREFSLQNLWEEAVDGLESYSSHWSGVTITRM